MECDRNDNDDTRKTVRLPGKCRCLNGSHSFKYCPIALSKEARNKDIDRLRFRRMNVIMQTKYDTDDSCESSASSESSEDEYSSDESSDEASEVDPDQQEMLEMKRGLQQQTPGLLLKLTQYLRICKRKVDVLSPRVFRPNVSQLKSAVDIAHYVAESVKSTSVSCTAALHRMTVRAENISNVMHIAENMYSPTVYSSLVRIRSTLNLAVRVATVLQAYSSKISYVDILIHNKKKFLARCRRRSSEVHKGSGDGMDFSGRSQQDSKTITQEVEMVKEDETSTNAACVRPRNTIAYRKCVSFRANKEQSARFSRLAISKEARKATFDRQRRKRISVMLTRTFYTEDSNSDSDDSDDESEGSCSDSEGYTDLSSSESSDFDSEDESSDEGSSDEYSSDEDSEDDDSDSCSEESDNEDCQEVSEAQSLKELKKKLRQQIAMYMAQLNKCLGTCKREVFSLHPNHVRPDINKLRDAVDNALFMSDRIKRLSIRSTSYLKTTTQTAANVAHLVYVPNHMHSTATRSSYHKLLRIKRLLNLAMRVASVLYANTERYLSSDSQKLQSSKVEEGTASDLAQIRKGVLVAAGQQDVGETSQSVMIVESPSGKEHSAKENRKDVNNTSGSIQNPQKLVVSFPSPAKLKASNQAVMDDVVDGGVAMVMPHSGETISDYLWKVRRDVVERQKKEASVSVLRSVEKQSVFKSSCRKNRPSPYAGRSTSRNVSHTRALTNTEEKACASSSYPKSYVVSPLLYSALKQPLPLKCIPSQQATIKPALAPNMPLAQSVMTCTSFFSHPSRGKPTRKAEISMDELANLFRDKCNISKIVSYDYSRMSFRDPGQYKLTSPVIPKEQYPGTALQDGGVKFVLRDSPLTRVLQSRKLQRKSPKILSCSTLMISGSQSAQKSFKDTTKPLMSGLCPLIPAAVTKNYNPLCQKAFLFGGSMNAHWAKETNNYKAFIQIPSPSHSFGTVTADRMSKSFLHNAGHDVVHEQSVTTEEVSVAGSNTPSSVTNNLIFKTSHKNRCTPNFAQSASVKALHSTKTKGMKHHPSKIQFSISDLQRRNTAEIYPAMNKCESVKCTNYYHLPEQCRAANSTLSNMPPVQSVGAKTSLSIVLNKTEQLNALWSNSAQQRPQTVKPDNISMDELANLFGDKCNISNLVRYDYSRMSFRDPGQYKLTSPVIPKEQYPGIALKDGGVKFVLRESPLTQVLRRRKPHGKDPNTSSLSTPQQSGQAITANVECNSTNGVKKLHEACSVTPLTTEQKAQGHSTSAAATIMKPPSRVILKATKRRLNRNLSNPLAARKYPPCDNTSPSEKKEYRKIMGTHVDVLTSTVTEKQFRRVQLGKRSATEAGLPIPKGK